MGLLPSSNIRFTLSNNTHTHVVCGVLYVGRCHATQFRCLCKDNRKRIKATNDGGTTLSVDYIKLNKRNWKRYLARVWVRYTTYANRVSFDFIDCVCVCGWFVLANRFRCASDVVRDIRCHSHRVKLIQFVDYFDSIKFYDHHAHRTHKHSITIRFNRVQRASHSESCVRAKCMRTFVMRYAIFFFRFSLTMHLTTSTYSFTGSRWRQCMTYTWTV